MKNKKIIRTKSKIGNFDTENFLIPTINGNIRYKIHSFIIHIGETLQSGHYYLWTRQLLSNGWIQLNDTKSRKLSRMYESLDNVNFVILERILE